MTILFHVMKNNSVVFLHHGNIILLLLLIINIIIIISTPDVDVPLWNLTSNISLNGAVCNVDLQLEDVRETANSRHVTFYRLHD